MNTVTFKPSEHCGKIKPLHAVNNGPIKAGSDQTRGNFPEYKAAGIPFARNHDASFYSSYGGSHTVDVNNIFTDFSRDINDPDAYDFTLTDIYTQTILESGAHVFYRLGAAIEHSVKKYNTLPPKDFKKWAQICEHIIRHYNEGWANGFEWNIQYWEIWNEPDLNWAADNTAPTPTWGGTKEQFFDLYEITAKHLKSCFQNLKIGGPALAGQEDWAADFLAEMRKRDVPMDFFSWHVYPNVPEKMFSKAERIKALMDKNGYGNAESILNEWNYVKGWSDDFIYTIEQIISIKGAAFTAACILGSQYTSIDMLMYYDARPSVFNGLFDFYTLRPIKGYYAISLFNELYKAGTQIACDNGNDGVYALGAADGSGAVKLMIACFTDDDTVTESRKIKIKVEGMKNTELKRFLVDSDTNEETEPIKLDGDGCADVEMKPNSFMLLS